MWITLAGLVLAPLGRGAHSRKAKRAAGAALPFTEMRGILESDGLRRALSSCYDPAKNRFPHRTAPFWYVRALGAHLAADEIRRTESPALDFFDKSVLPDLQVRVARESPEGGKPLLARIEEAVKSRATSSVPLKQILVSDDFASLLAALRGAAKGPLPWEAEWESLRQKLTPIVKVAVLDTGLDATHPVFAGRTPYGKPRMNTEEKLPEGFFGKPRITGHGTHVAGTIVVLGYNAEVAGYRVFGDDLAEARAYQRALDEGAKLTNGSWGFGLFDDEQVATFRRLMRDSTRQGAIHVMAAGNSGNVKRASHYYPGSISTGSIDEAGNRSWFSQDSPDFVSYGELLFAPRAGGMPEGDDPVADTTWGGKPARLVGMRGTSMASPALTGISTYALTELPDLHRDELYALLEASAEDLDGRGPDILSGKGMPNAFRLQRLARALRERYERDESRRQRRKEVLAGLSQPWLLPDAVTDLEKAIGAIVEDEKAILAGLKPVLEEEAETELHRAAEILKDWKDGAIDEKDRCARLEEMFQALERAHFLDPSNDRYRALLAALSLSLSRDDRTYLYDFVRYYGGIQDRRVRYPSAKPFEEPVKEALKDEKLRPHLAIGLTKVLLQHEADPLARARLLVDLIPRAQNGSDEGIAYFLSAITKTDRALSKAIADGYEKLAFKDRVTLMRLGASLSEDGPEWLSLLFDKEKNPWLRLELAKRAKETWGEAGLLEKWRKAHGGGEGKPAFLAWLGEAPAKGDDAKWHIEQRIEAVSELDSPEAVVALTKLVTRLSEVGGKPFHSKAAFYYDSKLSVMMRTGRRHVPLDALIAFHVNWMKCRGDAVFFHIFRRLHETLPKDKAERKKAFEAIAAAFTRADDRARCDAELDFLRQYLVEGKPPAPFVPGKREDLRDIVEPPLEDSHVHTAAAQSEDAWAVFEAICGEDPLKCVSVSRIDESPPLLASGGKSCYEFLGLPSFEEMIAEAERLTEAKHKDASWMYERARHFARQGFERCALYLSELTQNDPALAAYHWKKIVLPRLKKSGWDRIPLNAFVKLREGVCVARYVPEICESKEFLALGDAAIERALFRSPKDPPILAAVQQWFPSLDHLRVNPPLLNRLLDRLVAVDEEGRYLALQKGGFFGDERVALSNLDGVVKELRREGLYQGAVASHLSKMRAALVGKLPADYSHLRRYLDEPEDATLALRRVAEVLPGLEEAASKFVAQVDEAVTNAKDDKARVHEAERLGYLLDWLEGESFVSVRDDPRHQKALSKARDAASRHGIGRVAKDTLPTEIEEIAELVEDLDAGRNCEKLDPRRVDRLRLKYGAEPIPPDLARDRDWTAERKVETIKRKNRARAMVLLAGARRAKRATTVWCLERITGAYLDSQGGRLEEGERKAYFVKGLSKALDEARPEEEVLARLALARDNGWALPDLKADVRRAAARYRSFRAYEPYRTDVMRRLYSSAAATRDGAVSDLVEMLPSFTATDKGMQVTLKELFGGQAPEASFVIRLLEPQSPLDRAQKRRLADGLLRYSNDEKGGRYFRAILKVVTDTNSDSDLVKYVLKGQQARKRGHRIELW